MQQLAFVEVAPHVVSEPHFAPAEHVAPVEEHPYTGTSHTTTTEEESHPVTFPMWMYTHTTQTKAASESADCANNSCQLSGVGVATILIGIAVIVAVCVGLWKYLSR